MDTGTQQSQNRALTKIWRGGWSMGKSSDDNHEEPRLKSIELGPEGDKSIILILT
jgi:hypothetical protein